MELGWEIQKTNVGIGVSLLEIFCVQIFWQNKQLFDIFDPNLPKNGFSVKNSK